MQSCDQGNGRDDRSARNSSEEFDDSHSLIKRKWSSPPNQNTALRPGGHDRPKQRRKKIIHPGSLWVRASGGILRGIAVVSNDGHKGLVEESPTVGPSATDGHLWRTDLFNADATCILRVIVGHCESRQRLSLIRENTKTMLYATALATTIFNTLNHSGV
jgi:hypothetical protein